MHVWLTVLLVVMGAVALVLVFPVRLDAHIKADFPRIVEGNVRMRFFCGLIRLQYKLSLHMLQDPPLTLLRTKKDGKQYTLWHFGKEIKPGKHVRIPLERIWERIDMKTLTIRIVLGIQDDAYLTAICVGLVSNFMTNAAFYLLRKKKKGRLRIEPMPDFQNECFGINLEGIAYCSPIHIITAILLWNGKNRKGRKTAWHILSKTS